MLKCLIAEIVIGDSGRFEHVWKSVIRSVDQRLAAVA